MKTAIIIPAHNEDANIARCLDSFVAQSLHPDMLLIVDDHSSDKTAEIALEYTKRHAWIYLYSNPSTDERQPGAKVVNAFNYGISKLSGQYDLIGKFDADIILPTDYFKEVVNAFKTNPKLGICSGLLYIQSGDEWIYEAIAARSHVRGPVKLYRRSCLDAMNGLRAGLGWDTADVLLAQYYGFETRTLPDLKVKHLRPTGAMYKKNSSFNQGLAYYGLRYRLPISVLAALKMSYYKKSAAVFRKSMQGYFYARRKRSARLVSIEEGRFIRKYRWRNIRSSLF